MPALNVKCHLSKPCKPWCLSLLLVGTLLLFSATAMGAEPAPPLEKKITALIHQLGADKSTDKITLGKLRPLIAQHQANPESAASNEVKEGLWQGVIEKIYVDHADAQGNIVSGRVQMYLHTGPEHLEVYFLDNNLDQVSSGQAMAISGYRAGERVIVPAKPVRQVPDILQGGQLKTRLIKR